MNFFTLLRQHALSGPDGLAVSSRFRDITYRKLWSRVERATARLQAEWELGPGDRLAYCGPAHPDALVAWIAAARCGAQFIPLEEPGLHSQAAWMLRELNARILLHADGAAVESVPPSVRAEPLSALIATRCPHQPSGIIEDPARPHLLRVALDARGSLQRSEHSLQELMKRAGPAPDQTCRIAGGLFEPPVLERVVLPVLAAASTLLLP